MSPQEAIAECRRAYPIKGARWPVPLIAYLDEPPSERHVFEWLTSCVGELLDHLGANTQDLAGSLALARRCATEGTPSEPIQRRAWELWSSRATDHPTQTAVAQLLFALLAHRERREHYRASCATPVILLDQSASHQGGLLERVLSNYSDYLSRHRLG